MPDYMHRAILKAYLQTAVHNPLSDEALDIYSRPWLGQIGQPAFYRQITQMEQKYTDELQGKYRIMDCPCIPIPNAGHLVQEDRPEAIVAAVLKQLADT